MAIPRLRGAYTVDIDVRNKKIGFVILQKKRDVNDRPIEY